jgi:hypothetical protein
VVIGTGRGTVVGWPPKLAILSARNCAWASSSGTSAAKKLLSIGR